MTSLWFLVACTNEPTTGNADVGAHSPVLSRTWFPSFCTRAMACGTGSNTRPRILPGRRTRVRLINPFFSAAYQNDRDSRQTRSPPTDGNGTNSGCGFDVTALARELLVF